MKLRDYQTDSLAKTLDSFKIGHRAPLVCLPCGAGKTVLFAYMAERSQAKGKTVWFLVHRRELLDQTVETFQRFNIPLNTIHIGMVMTYANHLNDYPKPDFIIFDEAHFSMANTWQKIVQAFPDAFLVGLTATPCRLDGKPLGETYDDLIVGITAHELIQQGWLSHYRYFAPSVADLSALKRTGKDYDTAQAAEILSQRAVFGDVIENYRNYADGLQTICYCSSVQHSKDMADAFTDAGINAVHFDGDTKPDDRKRIVQDFRNKKIQVLCNCDLISCGFDVPDCWCCILLRPTMSTALFIQQAMRALRPQPGKTAIILDHVNNYQRHGLPDDDRSWSLTASVKPPKQYSEEGILKIRQCPNCYYTYSGSTVCPNCGYSIGLTREEIKNIKEIHLAEIKRRRVEAAKEKVTEETGLDDCRTLAEIQAWCKRNGKKPGYGWYIWKGRQSKREIRA